VHIRRRHRGFDGAEVKPFSQNSYSPHNVYGHRANQYSQGAPQGHGTIDPPTKEWVFGLIQQDRIEEQRSKRRELERTRERKAFDDYERAWTIRELKKPSTGTGNGQPVFPSNLILSLIAAGHIAPVQRIDTNGNSTFSYELRNPSNAAARMGTGENNLSNPEFAELFRIFTKVLDERNKIIMQLIKANGKGDDIKRIGHQSEMKQGGKIIDQCQVAERSPSNPKRMEGQLGESHQTTRQQDIILQQRHQSEFNPYLESIPTNEDRKFIDGIRRMQENQLMERKKASTEKQSKSI
jgi:hypothetical protein